MQTVPCSRRYNRYAQRSGAGGNALATSAPERATAELAQRAPDKPPAPAEPARTAQANRTPRPTNLRANRSRGGRAGVSAATLIRDPHKIVVLSMVGTAAIIVVADARKGRLPSSRAVLGLGFAYVALAGLADVAGAVAGPLAMLVLVGVLLKEGTGALDAFSGALTGHGPLGIPNTPQSGAVSPAAVTGGAQGAGDVQPSRAAQNAVSAARTAIGAPYRFGGETREGFDCSGLCQWAYRLAGVNIPRTSEEQAGHGYPRVNEGNWAPGDLVFSDWGDGQASPGHVVMYAGGGQCIAAPHSGTTVQYEPVSTFLGSHYRGSVRPAPARAGG